MKLIEILVKAKVKFPDGANEAVQDGSGTVKFFDSFNLGFDGYSFWRGTARASFYCIPDNYIIGLSLASDYQTSIVTREEYEAAVAASKEMLVNKPVAWDGQGLPPVGAECEYKDYSTSEWHAVTITYCSNQVVVFSSNHKTFKGEPVEISKDLVIDSPEFRPVRTEAERKRSDICDKIYGAMTNAERKDNRSDMAEAVYDAIAAGKIHGVKVEAPDA